MSKVRRGLQTFSFLEIIEQYIVADGRVEGVFAWSRDVESDEDDEVDEGEFLDGKGIASVDDEEGYTHGDDHGDEDDALQQTEDEGKGAYDLGKDGEPEGEETAYTDGVGVECCHSGVAHELVIAVAEEEQAEEDAGDEQYGGVDGTFVFVRGEEECFE